MYVLIFYKFVIHIFWVHWDETAAWALGSMPLMALYTTSVPLRLKKKTITQNYFSNKIFYKKKKQNEIYQITRSLNFGSRYLSDLI